MRVEEKASGLRPQASAQKLAPAVEASAFAVAAVMCWRDRAGVLARRLGGELRVLVERELAALAIEGMSRKERARVLAERIAVITVRAAGGRSRSPSFPRAGAGASRRRGTCRIRAAAG